MVNNGKRYCVYIHIVPKEITKYDYDKYYIGITSKKVEARWGSDGNNYKRQFFYNAIIKYGWKNITHEVLYEGLTEEDAIQKEKDLIKEYNSMLGHRGYNGTSGGDGCNKKSHKARNVYCRETGVFYHSINIASEVTGERKSTIKGRCRNRVEVFSNHSGNHWFYADELYIEDKNCKQKSNPIVDLKYNNVYGGLSSARINLNMYISRHKVLTRKRYSELKSKERIRKHKDYRFVRLDLYLDLFEYIDTNSLILGYPLFFERTIR